jgi:hypothetical protein
MDSWSVDRSVDLDLRTPKAEANVSVWCEFGQIEPSPVMNTNTAEKPGHRTGFMLSIRP